MPSCSSHTLVGLLRAERGKISQEAVEGYGGHVIIPRVQLYRRNVHCTIRGAYDGGV